MSVLLSKKLRFTFYLAFRAVLVLGINRNCTGFDDFFTIFLGDFSGLPLAEICIPFSFILFFHNCFLTKKTSQFQIKFRRSLIEVGDVVNLMSLYDGSHCGEVPPKCHNLASCL